MQPLTTAEILETRERELNDRARVINAKERVYAEREKDFSPTVRLVMTLTAQFFGFVLLFILGFGTFPSGQENIAIGFNFIRKIMWIYLAASVAIPFLPLIFAAYRRRFAHGHIDFILLAYVAVDIFLLLLLVYQEGGLCRSMFLPVFFLIPTAYLIVERREKKYRWRRLFILLIIVGCICSSYRVAVELLPQGENGMLKPVNGTAMFIRWPIRVTDFSTLAHSSYDDAVFYASLISAFVPIFQILIIMLQERFRSEGDGNLTRPPNSQRTVT